MRTTTFLETHRVFDLAGRQGDRKRRAAFLKVEIVTADDGLPLALPQKPAETLTTEMVRETIESVRARRDEARSS